MPARVGSESAPGTGKTRATSLRDVFRKRNKSLKGAPAPAAPAETLLWSDLAPKYGSLRFPGSRLPLAKWARIDSRQLAAHSANDVNNALEDLLLNTWRLEPPSAIITVCGPWLREPGAPVFASDKLHLFKEGLANAVKSTNAWVVTRGLDDGGINSLVGKALEGTGKPCIGFALANVVHEHDTLDKLPVGSVHYYYYKPSKWESERSHGTLALNPYHSHFVFVEDGSNAAPDRVTSPAVAVRNNLCAHLADKDLSGDAVKTPVVLMMVNGDAVTIEMVKAAVVDESGPCVVFSDSGGAAADLYAYASSGRTEAERRGTLDELAAKADFPAYRDALLRHFPAIMAAGSCRGHNGRQRLQFIDLRELEDADQLELLIGEAVLNGCTTQRDEMLLAVAWGQPDILRSILENEVEWPGEISTCRDLKGLALQTALQRLDLKVVQTLVDFNAEAHLCSPGKLFDISFLKSSDAASMIKVKRGELWGDAAKHTEARWMEILEDLVDGYEFHLDVRKQQASEEATAACAVAGPSAGEVLVKPTWTDLMQWAVLIGQISLAQICWRRSRAPLRAALMASRLCRRLSHSEGCQSEADMLEEQADQMEQWACDLLDTMPEATAHTLLLLIRCSRNPSQHPVSAKSEVRQALWDASALDCSCEDDGRLAVPSKKVVYHKHARSLANRYFHGDSPGSRARIPLGSPWSRIVLQLVFFFVPGTLCEVMPTTWPEQPDFLSDNGAKKKDTAGGSKSSTKGMGSAKHGKGLAEHDEPEDWAMLSKCGGGVVEATADSAESHILDLKEDMASLRLFHFFFVPKVKFALYQCSYLAYIVLPVAFLLSYDTDSNSSAYLKGGKQPAGSYDSRLLLYSLPDVSWTEFVFWVWSLARYVDELFEIHRYYAACRRARQGRCESIYEGVRQYLRDAWNIVDQITCGLILTTVVLRSVPAYHDDHLCQVYTRGIYAIIIIALWMRLLQIMRISRSVGVLSIILGEMCAKDVANFTILFLVNWFGFGLALSVLQPEMINGQGISDVEYGVSTDHYWSIFQHFSSPFFEPLWGLLGDFDVGQVYEKTVGVGAVGWLIPLVLYVYLFFAVVVLLNLLIAAMSSTYEQISEKAESEWQFEFAQLILEYKDRKGLLPPPLNLIEIAINFVASLVGCCGGQQQVQAGFKLGLSQALEMQWQQKESSALGLCVKKHTDDEATAGEVSALGDRVDSLFEALNSQRAATSGQFAALNSKLDAMSSEFASLLTAATASPPAKAAAPAGDGKAYAAGDDGGPPPAALVAARPPPVPPPLAPAKELASSGPLPATLLQPVPTVAYKVSVPAVLPGTIAGGNCTIAGRSSYQVYPQTGAAAGAAEAAGAYHPPFFSPYAVTPSSPPRDAYARGGPRG